MVLCIPTNGGAGIDDTICAHFGSAAFFCLYDSDSEEVIVVPNRNAHHSHGTCHPMSQLDKYSIDGVVCGGMGQRAIQALNAEGVKIYHAASGSVREVVEQIKAGSLTEMTPAQACHGHSHGADHDHSQTAGHGRGRCCGRHPGDAD